MNITDVKSNLFSISLSKQGDLVQGIDFINQNITIVLLTRKGTDPMRPEFGCDVFSKLDKPINQVKSAIINDVITAINSWISEINIVKVTPVINIGQTTINIQWAFKNSTNTKNISVVYGAN